MFTVPQKMALAEITRKTYASIVSKLSSLNLDSEQEAYIAADITLWNATHNKLKVKLKGGSDGVEYDNEPLLNEIRARVLNGLGYSVGCVAGVFAGGISLADKLAREADTDRIAPSFTSDIHQSYR
jgi:hypothetical protein